MSTSKQRQGRGENLGRAVEGATAGRGGLFEKVTSAGGGFERQQAGSKAKALSIFKAVRAKCIDCMAGSRKSVRFCTSDGLHSLRCPLWPFRFGLRPETAARRYGADFLNPEAMPEANTNLDDLK